MIYISNNPLNKVLYYPLTFTGTSGNNNKTRSVLNLVSAKDIYNFAKVIILYFKG